MASGGSGLIKTGLFGGAFDPVHRGHTALARAVAEKFGLDRLVFIPTKNPPHKPPHRASASDRLNMLKLAVSGMGSLFSVSDTELVSPGVSYTYNTLEKWRADNPEDDIYFISGSDIFSTIESWFRWRDVLAAAKFIVVKRAGFGFDKMFSALKTDFSAEREKGRLLLYDADIADISSSFVRSGGRIDPCFVPEPVLEYIKSHKLYEGSK